jgi:peptidoglycan-associated lipoprotein
MVKLKKNIGLRTVQQVCLLVFLGSVLFGCPKKAPPPVAPPKEEVKKPVEKPTPPPPKPVVKPEPPKPVTPPPAPPKEPEKPKRIPQVDFVESHYDIIYFEFDKSRLLSQARRTLEKNAELLRKDLQKNPKLKLLIDGHCDERGTNEYNLALGERRAFSARDYLISLGIPANVLYTKSWGEEKPVDPRHNEEAWAKNRRAEFSIYRGE